MIRKSAVILLLLALLSISCGNRVDPDVVYSGTYGSYVKVLREWTRSDKVYVTGFDTVMTVTATYESKRFRDAMIAERARAQMLKPTQIERLKQENEEELGRFAVFFVKLYMPDYKYNRLDKDDSGFSVWLIDKIGRKVSPVKIKEVRIKTVDKTKFYPFTDEWSDYYEVRFPRETSAGEKLELESGELKLSIASVVGKAELAWVMP